MSLSSEQLLPVVYDELRRLAASHIAREKSDLTLQPTALVHEAWIRLGGATQNWNDRVHFYRAAALAMRRILIDRARHKATQKRGGRGERLDITKINLEVASPDESVLLVDDSLQRLEQRDPESAEIVVLKFFTGLSNKEVAKTLNISEATVERRWAYARASLFDIIRGNALASEG